MLKTFGFSTSIFSGLGFDLGGSWPLPNVSWALLGRSWVALGRSWAALGPVLGSFLVLLGTSWLSNEAPGSIFKVFGRVWGTFWRQHGVFLAFPTLGFPIKSRTLWEGMLLKFVGPS